MHVRLRVNVVANRGPIAPKGRTIVARGGAQRNPWLLAQRTTLPRQGQTRDAKANTGDDDRNQNRGVSGLRLCRRMEQQRRDGAGPEAASEDERSGAQGLPDD